jgi:hypothetical protein
MTSQRRQRKVQALFERWAAEIEMLATLLDMPDLPQEASANLRRTLEEQRAKFAAFARAGGASSRSWRRVAIARDEFAGRPSPG